MATKYKVSLTYAKGAKAVIGYSCIHGIHW